MEKGVIIDRAWLEYLGCRIMPFRGCAGVVPVAADLNGKLVATRNGCDWVYRPECAPHRFRIKLSSTPPE